MLTKSITSTVRYHEVKPGYRVGDDGSIWSQVYPAGPGKRRWGEWRLLRPTPQQRYGHMTVYLGRKDQRFVHRLVLEAFVGPCPEGMECRHLDGNPANNRLENLAWGTRKENCADSVRHGTAYLKKGQESPHRKIDASQAAAAVRMARAGWFQADIAKFLGVHETTVGAVLTGRSWASITGLKYEPKSSGRKGQARTRLTQEQVTEIRAMSILKMTVSERRTVAALYGVGDRYLEMIAKGTRR